jgi:hypothetical protein
LTKNHRPGLLEPTLDSLPRILPRPRHVERLQGSTPANAPVVRRRTTDLPVQGYAIDFGPAEVHLDYADAEGERYGLAALDQIRRQSSDSLPRLRIRDWPDFAVRGYMLDVSRDRVPTRATLERIVDLLALLRINHLQLYTEHTFAYRAHESVWRDASPMTPEDIRWLDGLCGERGIEFAANQNGFGHMERWLQHEDYRHLAEAPDGWKTSWGEPWRAGVLHPDRASRDFVLNLYRELLPCFSSRRINVNFDETFELGKGRSRQRVEAEGRGRVYLDFLRPIVEELHARGAEVLFWGDVLRHHPELVKELPASDLIALVWHYEAPIADPRLPAGLESILAEVGIDENVLRGFAGQVPLFAESGMPFWVCPGTSTWNSLVGRWSNAKANLLDAATVGAAHGAGGFLITDWGDNGHMQPPSASLVPLAFGACLAWCAASNRDIDVAGTVDTITSDLEEKLGSALVRAAELYSHSGAAAFNGSPLFYPLVGKDASFGSDAKPTVDSIARVLAEIADIDRQIESSAPGCGDGELIVREMRQALRLTRIGAKMLARNHGVEGREFTIDRGEIASTLHEQRACWLARSRPGGLDDSIGKIRIEEWKDQE